jgi:hypothetical protein
MVFVAIAGDTRPRIRMMARERVEETILDFEELFGVNVQEHIGAPLTLLAGPSLA